MRKRILVWLALCALALGIGAPALAVEAAEQAGTELIVELSGEAWLRSGGSEEELAALEREQDRLLEEIRALDASAVVLGRYTCVVNAVSVRVPARLAGEIQELDGVSAVHTPAQFTLAETELCAEPESGGYTVPGDMTGLTGARQQGLDGSGVVIAVIDSGLDLEHPAFSADGMAEEEQPLTRDALQSRMGRLNAVRLRPDLGADELYHSAKVPFAFNYLDWSDDVSHAASGIGDHGTHVAAIAAGVETEELGCGVAPGAQLLVMKVFGSSGTVSEVMLLSALEDAVVLGADVINLSMGSPSGFAQTDLVYRTALQNALDAGIIVCAAAGNDFSSAYGNTSGSDLGSAENVDVGIIDEPSSLDGVLSVASVNSAMLYANGFLLEQEDGASRLVAVSDDGAQFGLPDFASLLDRPGHEDGVYEYVVVPGLGAEEDYAQVDAAGRIALIERGDLTFAEKCDLAFAHGAAAVVIYNNVVESVNMDLSGVAADNRIPCVNISREDGERMVDSAGADGVGTLTVLSGMTLADAEDGWQPSAFSSWGPLADLTLKPDLAAVGGNVYSATDNGTYGVKSGTSMASPQAAGMAALLLQAAHKSGLSGAGARERAQTLLLNTAVPLLQEDGVEYSPRKQGAGLANVGDAVSTPVWVSVDGSELPKAELGDNKSWSGVFTFSLTLHNTSGAARTYSARASLLTETARDGVMLQTARRVDASVTCAGPDVTLLSESGVTLITVPAYGETSVRVTVRLSGEERQALRETFENGIYIEGYFYLDSPDARIPGLSLPMLAFYGDWSRAPLFERTGAADLQAASAQEGDGNCPVGFRILTGAQTALGENPLAQDEEYIPARSNALNASGGRGGVVSNVLLDLLRNAASVTLEAVDCSGQVLYQSSIENVVKSHFSDSISAMYPAMWSSYGSLYFNPADYGLGDGSTFTLRLTGEKVSDGAYATEVLELPVYVDGTAPQFQSVTALEGEEQTVLQVTVTDNFYTAALAVRSDGAEAEQVWAVNQQTRGAQTVMELDVTELLPSLGGSFQVVAMDYAGNAAYYEITL